MKKQLNAICMFKIHTKSVLVEMYADNSVPTASAAAAYCVLPAALCLLPRTACSLLLAACWLLLPAPCGVLSLLPFAAGDSCYLCSFW